MSDTTSPQTRLYQDWGFDARYAVCNHCGWSYLLPPQIQSKTCPHCFRSELDVHEALAPDFEQNLVHTAPPELVIPHQLPAEEIAKRVQDFARGIPFAPRDLTPQNLAGRLQQIFLPIWLVDASVRATWQFEAGFDYQVVSHQERYSDYGGGWKTQEVKETRVRWEPRLGRLERLYPNLPVPALEEHRELQRSLGDYDQSAARPYQPEMALRSLVKLPNRAQDDAWSDAIPKLQAVAAKECQAAAGANHQRDFRWSPEFVERNWTLLLAPIFTTYYLDDERQPQAIYINGQSGQVSGVRRASSQRARRASLVILAVALVLFLISAALALAGVAVPVLVPLAGLGFLLAVLMALSAIIPVAMVWQFNRSQRAPTS